MKPVLLQHLLSLCILGVVFVNGFTDAPNAIATAVGTKSMSRRSAILMCAVLNFLGTFFMASVSGRVADTVTGMVSFAGDPEYATAALTAAMFSIVVWAVLAWAFSIPTSESHALIAGLLGAAVSLNGLSGGIGFAELGRVLAGLVLSVAAGFGLGFLANKAFLRLFSIMARKKYHRFFRGGQVASAMAMSFLHGAQDGQKFIAVYVIGSQISRGIYSGGTVDIGGHLGICLLCSLIMGLGTSFGGGRIIQSVGSDMVRMEVSEGFAADLSSSIALGALSILGFPVSTTQVKTTAIMGVGRAKGKGEVNRKIVREMFLAWVLTFPICFLLSFAMVKLLTAVFCG